MTSKNDKPRPKKNGKQPRSTRNFRLSLLGFGLVALAYVVTIAALFLR